MRLLLHIVTKMGIKYLLFRAWYEFAKKVGLLKFWFTTKFDVSFYIDIQDWRNKHAKKFFFPSRESIIFTINQSAQLSRLYNLLISGKINYFDSGDYSDIMDWFMHPVSNFVYPKSHWTIMPISDTNIGDIKYVWERARFSNIGIIIQYDLAYSNDSSRFVLNEIIDFIENNPINIGPHYICSQEISIRLLNWIIALHFYSNSQNLSQEKFDLILSSITAQVEHVNNNLSFSTIAVRNNHAISESLMLYVYGIVFEFLPNSKKYFEKGKKSFYKEISFQIMEDGADNQYSFNYHRVKIQLYTWFIFLSEKNKIKIEKNIINKLRKTTEFLSSFLLFNGRVPNFGANDGSIYFKLSHSDYCDFRPQLIPLLEYFNISRDYEIDENSFLHYCWYSNRNIQTTALSNKDIYPKLIEFKIGGYYGFKESSKDLLMVRLGNYLHRPSQSDNGHIDWWLNGENILIDGGSYKYLSDPETEAFFSGVKSHNTFSVGDYDQMEKGPNFIWFNWSSSSEIDQSFSNGVYTFSGVCELKIEGHSIKIKRSILKTVGSSEILVTDQLLSKTNLELTQNWHFVLDSIIFSNVSRHHIVDYDNSLTEQGSYSLYYGQKMNSNTFSIHSQNDIISTFIKCVAK